MDSETFYSIAESLGDYYMQSEWKVITNNISNIDTSSFESFLTDIKKYYYYNTVVLFNKGDDKLIIRQLEDDYEDLKSEMVNN